MTRFGFQPLLIFLVIGCILLKDAPPILWQFGQTKMEFTDNENSAAETKLKNLGEYDFLKLKNDSGTTSPFIFPDYLSDKKLLAESEDIPDSASRSIFSPPPNLI